MEDLTLEIKPPLTIQMNRVDSFDQLYGCGEGQFTMRSDGLVDTISQITFAASPPLAIIDEVVK